MKIKLDENLSHCWCPVFHKAGYEVDTVADEGLCGASDVNLSKKCRDEKRCLVTLDLDFANPLIFNPSEYHGIVVLRLPKRPSFGALEDLINTLIAGLKTKSADGKLWIIQKGRLREYQQEEDES